LNKPKVVGHSVLAVAVVLVGAIRPNRAASAEAADNAIAVAVCGFLGTAKGLEENKDLRGVISGAIEGEPGVPRGRWEGVNGGDVFVVVAKPVPKSPKATGAVPAMIKVVNVVAFNELLKTAVAVECFSGNGLEDRDILLKAIGRAGFTGVLKGVRHEEAVSGDYVVGYAVVDAAQLRTAASAAENVTAVRRAYLQCMHDKATELINKGAFDEAIKLCEKLRSDRLASGDILLSHAKALHAADRKAEAVDCLRCDLQVYVRGCSAGFLERLGDLALEWGADDVARDAFRAASVKMLESESVNSE
jgi:hypothetical protein